MKLKKETMNIIMIIGLCVSFFIIGRHSGQKDANEALNTTLQAVQAAELSQGNTIKCMDILHRQMTNKPWITED